MWRIAQIEASAPQDDVALAQSALLGFGAGHFYAGNRTRGLTHARVQGAGVFLTLVGAMLAAIGEEDGVIAGGTTLVAIGSGGLAVSRLVDLITAPYSARDARERAMIHDPPRELSSAPASSSGPASSATAERPVPLKVRPPGSPLPQPGLCIYRPGIGPETTFVVGDARLVVGANQFACAPMSEGPVVVIIEGRRNSWEGYVPSSETLYLQMLAGGLLRSDEVAFQRAVLAGMQDVSPE
jgi:TM2 domain-containing membrane protein YozV